MAVSKVDIMLGECEKAYLAEKKRTENLANKAEKYLAAVAIIIAFTSIKFEQVDLAGGIELFFNIFVVVAFFLLGVTLLLVFVSMRVEPYISYPRGERLIDELKGEDITSEVAKVKIAKMYLYAQNKNALINDKHAKLLSWSLISLTVGFLSAVTGQIFAKLALK